MVVSINGIDCILAPRTCKSYEKILNNVIEEQAEILRHGTKYGKGS